MSIWTTEKVKAEGVNIINNVQVKSAKLNQESGEVNLLLDDGQTVTTDHVVVAVGIEPETNLAKESGLAIDDSLGGFKVNEELEARYWISPTNNLEDLPLPKFCFRIPFCIFKVSFLYCTVTRLTILGQIYG